MLATPSPALTLPIRLGTQGWNYDSWVGPFYPERTKAADFLSTYARGFNTVEVDSTFYAIPSVRTVRGWALQQTLAKHIVAFQIGSILEFSGNGEMR